MERNGRVSFWKNNIGLVLGSTGLMFEFRCRNMIYQDYLKKNIFVRLLVETVTPKIGYKVTFDAVFLTNTLKLEFPVD